jgi:uncharacterized protein (UPF0332 family)
VNASEIGALVEKAKESLEVAIDLVRDGHHDFAASRAYYAMFYVAEALLANLGQSYSRHSAVIGAFGREYSKTRKLPAKFHKWLIAAHNFRNIGDYGIDAHVTREQASSTCEWANDFIAAAEELLKAGKTRRK